MRSYGTPCGEDKVFLEIKKKYNGIVNKRRTSIVLKDAYKYMESDVYPESDTQCINTQVLKEIDYFKKMYTLKPDQVCVNMKMVTLDKVLDVLEQENNEVFVDEEVAKKAMKPLTRMLELAK